MWQTLLEEESADDLWYPPEDVTFIVQHHLLLVQKRANTVTDYVRDFSMAEKNFQKERTRTFLRMSLKGCCTV